MYPVKEAAWLSGWGAGLVIRRRWIQIPHPATGRICVRWSQSELLHVFEIANWSASNQNDGKFYRVFSSVYTICLTITVFLVFFYLNKLLFSGFVQFKRNFVRGQNNSKYRT